MTAKIPQRLPKFRIHKATQQAYVELSGRRIYLGYHAAPTAQQKYHALVAEWLASNRQLRPALDETTIKELIAHYWTYCETYYRSADGHIYNEVIHIQQALRPVKQLYGDRPAVEFGPLALRAVRQKLIERGLCRKSINRHIGRIRRAFKWAASEELIPGSIFHALLSLEGLRRGRCAAAEGQPVRPVPDQHIQAARPLVSRQVWAMVQLQMLTAARPGETLAMRPVDIDMSGRIWVYTPAQHKTAHHGHERKVYIGPRGQQVLEGFLKRHVDSYCFSPSDAERERREILHAHRQTPLAYGNRPGTNCCKHPQRTPGECYTIHSYRRAIARACKKAGVPLWHPHQLRHNAATLLRKEFGLETARIILGHRSAAITTIYAEADQQKAIEAMLKVG